MTDIQIGLLSIVGILFLIYAGMHVSIALMLLSLLGVWLIKGNWAIASEQWQGWVTAVADEITTRHNADGALQGLLERYVAASDREARLALQRDLRLEAQLPG